MELRNLQALVEVVRQNGFGAAADKLCVTQPTISKQIRQLEQALGETLLLRAEKPVRLTDAGTVVLRHAEVILAELASLQHELADLGGKQRGELAIGISPLSSMMLMPKIAAFKHKYPGIELRFFEEGANVIEEELLAGRIEVGGLLMPVDESRFAVRALVKSPMVLVAPQKSAWARRQSVRLAELADEPFILFSAGYALNARIEAACQTAGFTPFVAGRSGQWDLIIALVENGVGIALLPACIVAMVAPERVHVCELTNPRIDWESVIAWRRDAYLSHAARAWIELFGE